MAITTMGRIHLAALAGRTGAFPSTCAAVAAGSLASRMRGAYECILEHARAKRDMRRLEQLDDRMLRDIGITRSEIASAIFGRPSGERRCHDHA